MSKIPILTYNRVSNVVMNVGAFQDDPVFFNIENQSINGSPHVKR